VKEEARWDIMLGMEMNGERTAASPGLVRSALQFSKQTLPFFMLITPRTTEGLSVRSQWQLKCLVGYCSMHIR
jgi:hypothetical protein